MEIIIEKLVRECRTELATATDSKRIKELNKILERIDKPYEETLSYILMHGISMHTETQKSVYGTTDKSLVDYDNSKRLNFSVIYGIGASTLSDRLGMSIKEAGRILGKYHARFPGFRLLYNQCQKIAEEQNYIRMWTGRVRHYGPKIPPHKASSNVIQGGVAEILRIAIQTIDAFFTDKQLDCHMLLQIHDQILFEIPDELLFTMLFKIKSMMENVGNFRVPPKVDIKYGKSWGKMTEWKENA